MSSSEAISSSAVAAAVPRCATTSPAAWFAKTHASASGARAANAAPMVATTVSPAPVTS
jgi:hypothetical protein